MDAREKRLVEAADRLAKEAERAGDYRLAWDVERDLYRCSRKMAWHGASTKTNPKED